jgi:hypothetical protein
MRTVKAAALSSVAFAMLAALATTTASAAEKDLGKHSPDEIKNACNAAGGELLGFSELGSYGCEVASTGAMILCNKNQNCTGYTAARTKSDRNKILSSIHLRKV